MALKLLTVLCIGESSGTASGDNELDSYLQSHGVSQPLGKLVASGAVLEGLPGGPVQGITVQGSKPLICFDFTKGLCTRGDKCKYSHDLATIVHFNSKEKGICFDYLRNQCHRGLLCRFSHDLSNIAQQCQIPCQTPQPVSKRAVTINNVLHGMSQHLSLTDNNCLWHRSSTELPPVAAPTQSAMTLSRGCVSEVQTAGIRMTSASSPALLVEA